MYRSSKDSAMGEWNTLFKYCWRTSLTMEHVEERQLDADDVLIASGISDTCGDLMDVFQKLFVCYCHCQHYNAHFHYHHHHHYLVIVLVVFVIVIVFTQF